MWHAPTTNETNSTCYRGGMAHDIRQRLLNQGMSRADVVRLLGEPDGHSTMHEYRYVLGMCSGFLMDYDDLHVYFNNDGNLSHAEIIQH